ncbi:BZ3500_MvSof-1268-A1-R1_Chr1-1g00950 [Microbotryum saponariae]|uniref:COX assembly mitochondrial protein n=1 Tax=Microbotryum saponariae TaxID=289078 RepID=A0A2X0KI03_9BASI|nr:BZ3500_MvSof-1268-A1-R1_Chr1-1g00950 [Microbotryum saponariae]SCZ93009.1 BZ3501_MvSof-1269-A2-R1_Chr1-1g00547 [Microbotryum saponariae]
MHPPLAEHQHQGKRPTPTPTPTPPQRTRLRIHCHDQHSILKFIGYCNDHKTALNLCLGKERTDRAIENRQQAKAKRQLIQARWDQIERES